jgi:hypothetical protein
MTPFEQHGIKWLSHSCVNMFRDDMSAWFLRYPMKIRGSTNANMARGNAVEEAVGKYLSDEFGCTTQEAIDTALRAFSKETALLVDKGDREKAAEQIPGYVENAIEALSPFGKPINMQTRLELDIGAGVPVIGFDDFEFDGEPKLSIDLKTSGRLPSQMPDNHKRQGALYQAMRPEHKIMFCYVTPKKHAIYELNKAEAMELMDEFKIAVEKMKTFLSLSRDPKDFASIFAPSYSSFYWNDPIMRVEAKRVFGV